MRSIKSNLKADLMMVQNKDKCPLPISVFLNHSTNKSILQLQIPFTSNSSIVCKIFKVPKYQDMVWWRTDFGSFSFINRVWAKDKDGINAWSLTIQIPQHIPYQMQLWSMVSITWAIEISETNLTFQSLILV